MKKPYPKNRKGIAGRPLARATEHKLNCRFCGGLQDVNLVNRLFKQLNKKDSSLTLISYPCDHCPRSLRIYKSVSGFYLIQSSLDKRKKWAKQFIENERTI
jgi:hypothetical protein